MAKNSYSIDRLGETCPDCGTHHRVVASLPNTPLTDSVIGNLENSEKVHFARGVGMATGGLYGMDTDDLVSDDLVISMDSSTRLLARHDEVGWVVEQEIDHEDTDVPVEVGEEIWMEASSRLSEAFERSFG